MTDMVTNGKYFYFKMLKNKKNTILSSSGKKKEGALAFGRMCST